MVESHSQFFLFVCHNWPCKEWREERRRESSEMFCGRGRGGPSHQRGTIGQAAADWDLETYTREKYHVTLFHSFTAWVRTLRVLWDVELLSPRQLGHHGNRTPAVAAVSRVHYYHHHPPPFGPCNNKQLDERVPYFFVVVRSKNTGL